MSDGVKPKQVVVALTFPFSIETYDAVSELMDIGQFKLVNPRRPDLKPLEIFLAPTLAELQEIVPVQFAKPTVAITDESEEEPVALDLTPGTPAAMEQ